MSFRLVVAFCLLTPLIVRADNDRWANHPDNQWVKQSPTADQPAPPFGWEGSGDYDPQTKRWIHHAGHDGIPQGFHLFTYDFESRVWEQKFPPTSPPGVCCVDGSNVFDIAQRRFVRFPGGMLGHGYQWSRGEKLKDSAVWLYDPVANTWMNMRPEPYARNQVKDAIGGLDAGATYDPRSELAISFGGQVSTGGTNNFSLYDAYANKLYRITAPGAPSARDGMGICVDPKNDCLVVFGSQYASDERTHLFHFRTGKWEALDLTPRPPGKKQKTYSTIPKMAYDVANGVCLCVVWDDATGKHQTWALDVAKKTWTKMNPPTEPDPSMSRSRNLGYSAEHNVFILETSPQATRGKGTEIWTYRFKKASPLIAPPAELTALSEKDRVKLTWQPVANAKNYRVYRAPAGAPWKLELTAFAETERTGFDDTKAEAGTDYVYSVRAVTADGSEGPMSARARSTPRVLIKPIVSVLSAKKVVANWNAHPAGDIAGYNVYRGLVSLRTVKKGEPKPWRDNDPEYAEPMPVEVRDITGIKKLNDKTLTETTFVDESVELSKAGEQSDGYKFAAYAYLIRAVNRRGSESGPSPYALTIPSEPLNVLNRDKGASAELKWDPSPEKGITGYHVYKLEGTWNIKRLTDEPLKATTFTHKATGPTRYWIVAVDALGQEGQPSSPAWHGQSYGKFFKGEWHQ
jgi:hypothetical protein